MRQYTKVLSAKETGKTFFADKRNKINACIASFSYLQKTTLKDYKTYYI